MKLILACLTLLVVVHGSSGCSCLPATVEEKICNANFILRVNIVKGFQYDDDDNMIGDNKDGLIGIPHRGFYQASIVAVFRGEDISNGQSRLYTGANSAMCGISQDLEKGQYVVIGHKSGDELWLNSCSSVIKTWDDMTSLVSQLIRQPEANNNKDLEDMIDELCPK